MSSATEFQYDQSEAALAGEPVDEYREEDYTHPGLDPETEVLALRNAIAVLKDKLFFKTRELELQIIDLQLAATRAARDLDLIVANMLHPTVPNPYDPRN